MRLGIKPAVFLGRLLVCFFLTYLLWIPVAPAYTRVLATLTRGFVHLTELSTDPRFHQVTQMEVRETAEGRPAIFFGHRLIPQLQSGIPAEWVQANLVLLIPLMLAMPARTYGDRFWKLSLAVAIAVVLQVLDITVTVKSFYAANLPGYSDFSRRLYQFGDAFTQAMDTQLFPFAIWAGIHFNQLLGRKEAGPALPTAAATQGKTRAARRRAQRRAAHGA